MFSMSSTVCSSSNDEEVISGEMRGNNSLTDVKRIERNMEKVEELGTTGLRLVLTTSTRAWANRVNVMAPLPMISA